MVSIVPLSELGIESKNALHSLDIAEVASPSAYTAVFETAGDDGAEDYGTLLNTGFKGGGSESSNEAGTSFCTEYVDECPDDDNSFSWEEPEFDIPALSD